MKVLVAMSGGVDSSVAAALMVEAGHEVVGATLKLWGGASDSGCCSVSDVDDARRVAHALGIDHHVFNYSQEFEERVVSPYVAGIAAGVTPNPCIDCNRYIKFDVVMDRAERLGFDYVVTGHYARIRRDHGVAQLVRGVDPLKDQSYVLAHLAADRLERLILPIGEMEKPAVRAEAQRLGLKTWNKPDSQDVCFIEASNGREAFLRTRIELTTARVVDSDTGADVGELPAAELVTVGQRRGIAPGRDGERRYVKSVDLAARQVTISRLEDIVTRTVHLDDTDLHFIRGSVSEQRLRAQVSAHGRVYDGELRSNPWRFESDSDLRPVAPGQTLVFYDREVGDTVVGAATVVAR
jgi:tRNA-specific 2-thiouridylase